MSTRGTFAIFGQAGAAALACLALAFPARADDAKIASTQLFNDAAALVKLGDYANACPKFAESLRLDFQIGTLYWLADCQEHTNKLASAWANFLDAAEKASLANKPGHAKEAKARADALRGRLSKMILVVSEDLLKTPGLQVQRDGVVIGPAQFGVPLAVDSGKHEITVAATGKRAWQTSLEVAGEGNTFTVTVPTLKEEPPVGPLASAPPSNPGAGAWTAHHTGAVLTAAAGLVGLAVGAGFGVETMNKTAAAKSMCNADVTLCTPEGVQLHREARSTATVSNVAFALGGAAVVAGVVLWATAPARQPARTGVSVRVRMAGTYAVAEGAW